MRAFLALLLVAALAGVAAAQTPPPAPAMPSFGPLPPITTPLPPIGLPLPSLGLPPPPDVRPEIAPIVPSRPVGADAGLVVFVPAYGWTATAPGMIERNTHPAPLSDTPGVVVEEPPHTGTLRLEIEPAHAQLFVDGEFVGTVEDFNGEIELDEGPHIIELRSPGYEVFNVRVRITPGRTITYRETLKRQSPAAAAAARPAREPAPPAPPVGPSSPRPDAKPITPTPKPSTFYYIPGCYMGNVPPQDMKLPETCDLSQVITRKP